MNPILNHCPECGRVVGIGAQVSCPSPGACGRRSSERFQNRVADFRRRRGMDHRPPREDLPVPAPIPQTPEVQP